MTRDAVLKWLATRRPEPPEALRNQLTSLVNGAPDAVFTGASASTVMGALGLYALNLRLATLDSALDLLAADGFVTYAFEAAAEEGKDVTGLARALLGEVAA